MKEENEPFNPRILENTLIDGIAGESISNGSTGKIYQQGFISSFQKDFDLLADNMLRPFFKDSLNKANNALIVIDKNNTSKIYSDFPISVLTNAKGDVKKGQIITEENIFDMIELFFKDDSGEIKIDEGDKLIFLFRTGWKFGLYFDFTRKLNLETLRKNLAYFYKALFYDKLYSFIENESFFNDLIVDGWFPFIRLIGPKFDKIMTYYKESKKHSFHIDNLVDSFGKDEIESFTQYWWRKKLFQDRRGILKAGINSFLKNEKDGFIACLHILYPQIEGIIGIDYFKNHGHKPKFKELKDYIHKKAKSRFNTPSSVGFPSEFYKYLEKTVFQNFNLATGELDLSRHTTTHGYANSDDFDKARALQAILVLDQIYFYL